MIDASSVVIGDVRIADDVSVWPLVAIRGDVNYVSIGQRSNIQDGSVLHVTHKSSYKPEGNPLIIGEDVTHTVRTFLNVPLTIPTKDS